MARKPPGRARARDARRHDPGVDGLSARGRARVEQLERTRLYPGETAGALAAWERFVRDPGHWEWDPRVGCGDIMCCPMPEDLRRVLTMVASNLPPEDARAFRERLAGFDEAW